MTTLHVYVCIHPTSRVVRLRSHSRYGSLLSDNLDLADGSQQVASVEFEGSIAQ